MLNDLIVIDNFFDDPEKVLTLSKQCVYNSNNDSNAYWVGKRSEDLIAKDYDTYTSIVNDVVRKCIDEKMKDCSGISIKYSWNASVFFHKMYDEPEFNDKWFHQDSNCVYAGVVYLNKDAPKQFGTSIKKDKIISIDNVFNRLVLYRADYHHAPNGGFGRTDEEARLTMTMFFNRISFDVEAI